MAKLPRLAPALLALALAPPAQADWKFTPEIRVGQTFTDNAGLQSSEFAHSQWVTEVTPGFSVLHNSRRLKLSGSGQWSYFGYAHDIGDTRSNRRQYQGAAQAIVIDDLLFVDASAQRTPQSLSAFGPQLNNNPYALNNSSDVSTWRLSPYLRHRFGPSADLTARYTRDSVDAGIGAPGSSDSNGVDVRLASGSLYRSLGWGLSYNRQDISTKTAGDSRSESALADLAWRIARTLSLTATGGYDRYDYESIGGGSTEGNNWSAGFDWIPSSRTRVKLAGGRHFYGNTWDLEASHRSRRSVWSINYNDQITNSRDQFLRPAAVDTSAMIDAMFRSSIPDPFERRAAVAAYIAANGLTPGFGQSINYFSNRFIRQKGFNAAVIFNGPRSNLVLGAYDTRRTMLSVSEEAAEVSETELARLNANVHQRGASAILNYRITPRSIAHAGLTLGRSRSLTTDRVDNNQALRVGLTRQFGNRVGGTLEMHHARGSAGAGGSRYHENAISATITMQYSAR